MKSCTNCIHREKWKPGVNWEDLPCAHCTSVRAEQRRLHVKKQIITPARIDPPSVDDYIARRTVLAWTHVSRVYPAAAAYILAKMGDQSLSYAAIARRFKVSKTTVQYQISLAIMAEPELANLISLDHTRNRHRAHKKPPGN